MKVTSVIYQTIIGAVNKLPVTLRNGILLFLKYSRLIPYQKFYKDLRYLGIVKVKIQQRTFSMMATGGIIENEIFWKGLLNSLEPETVWIWEVLMRNGANTVIDVGANTGLYSLMTCSMNANANVIAFEPSVDTFKKLVDNIERNKFSIKAEQLAVSNITGKLVFYDTLDENQTVASLSSQMLKDRVADKSVINEYTVNTITLDKYVEHNNIVGVDLIKIDVELHEPEVFGGMECLVLRDRPFLLFEVLLPDVAASLNEFFSEKDYSKFEFMKTKNGYRLKYIDELVAKPNGDWNYLACPNEKLASMAMHILS